MLRLIVIILVSAAVSITAELLAFRLTRNVGELVAVIAPVCFGVAAGVSVGRATSARLVAALIAVVIAGAFGFANYMLLEQIALTEGWSISAFQHFQPAYIMMIAPLSCMISMVLAYWIATHR